MHQKVIGGVVLVGLLAVVIWHFSGNKAEAPATLETPESMSQTQEAASTREAPESENVSGLGSFASLMRMGRSLNCDFTYESDETNAASAGTVYIDGERMRGDFETTQGGRLYQSYMIHDGQHVYTWSQSAEGTFAMKMPAKQADMSELQDNAREAEVQASLDLDHEVGYDCRPWRVDEGQFVPPSNIKFMDMEATMQGAMPDMSDFSF